MHAIASKREEEYSSYKAASAQGSSSLKGTKKNENGNGKGKERDIREMEYVQQLRHAASAFIRKAIKHAPHVSNFHCNLAEVERSLGHLSHAAQSLANCVHGLRMKGEEDIHNYPITTFLATANNFMQQKRFGDLVRMYKDKDLSQSLIGVLQKIITTSDQGSRRVAVRDVPPLLRKSFAGAFTTGQEAAERDKFVTVPSLEAIHSGRMEQLIELFDMYGVALGRVHGPNIGRQESPDKLKLASEVHRLQTIAIAIHTDPDTGNYGQDSSVLHSLHWQEVIYRCSDARLHLHVHRYTKWCAMHRFSRALFNHAVSLEYAREFDAAIAAMNRTIRLQNQLDNPLYLEKSSVSGQFPNPVQLRPVGKHVLAIYCHEYGNTWWPRWSWANIDRSSASHSQSQSAPFDDGNGGTSADGTRTGNPLDHRRVRRSGGIPERSDGHGVGAGGSEEAVVFMSREMSKLGWHVEVYADPLPSEMGDDGYGVMWYSHTLYDIREERGPDVFVAWRYHVSLPLGINAKARYLWLQDVHNRMHTVYTDRLVDSIAGIFSLSEFHTRALSLYAHAQRKAMVTPNGLDAKYFVPRADTGANAQRGSEELVGGENEKTPVNLRFIYASAPNRGLELILDWWSYIVEGIRRASDGKFAEFTPTLNVYYGFSRSFLKWGETHNFHGYPTFQHWLTKVKGQLANLPGVTYVGMVNHIALAHAYARTGFSLYPTSYPETGCVSLMKAQVIFPFLT